MISLQTYLWNWCKNMIQMTSSIVVFFFFVFFSDNLVLHSTKMCVLLVLNDTFNLWSLEEESFSILCCYSLHIKNHPSFSIFYQHVNQLQSMGSHNEFFLLTCWPGSSSWLLNRFYAYNIFFMQSCINMLTNVFCSWSLNVIFFMFV